MDYRYARVRGVLARAGQRCGGEVVDPGKVLAVASRTCAPELAGVSSTRRAAEPRDVGHSRRRSGKQAQGR